MALTAPINGIRRVFGLALAAALAVGAVSAAHAQNSSEWNPRFDTGTRDETEVRTTRPILSPQTVASVDIAISQYQQIVALGGWPIVPADQVLRVGMQHPSVAILRQRLMVSGDLPPAAGVTDVFDSYVDAAVRHFQARHGIPADGVVGATTLAAMNVSAQSRLRQLIANRDRLVELTATTTNRYVLVNLPGAAIEAVENGVVASRHTAVVGRVDRPSPLLTSEIYEVNLNPTWTVPVSIIQRDLIPLMQREPNYLTEQKIHIYDGNGRELQPTEVNWTTNEATRYTFRQEPGDFNALGQIRINFHNPYSVYMHDTPNKTLFGTDYRFDSSGCVRVENVRGLITWLLRDTPGWTNADIERVLASGERINATLAQPVKVYFAYITAWSQEDGLVRFRDDIYNTDGIGSIASL